MPARLNPNTLQIFNEILHCLLSIYMDFGISRTKTTCSDPTVENKLLLPSKVFSNPSYRLISTVQIKRLTLQYK